MQEDDASHVYLRLTAARPDKEADACGVVLGLQEGLHVVCVFFYTFHSYNCTQRGDNKTS